MNLKINTIYNMNSQHRFSRDRRARFAAFGFALALGSNAFAGTHVWNGAGANGNANQNANDPNAPPPQPIGEGIRININFASRPVLRALFPQAKIPDEVIEAILKWRNEDDPESQDKKDEIGRAHV